MKDMMQSPSNRMQRWRLNHIASERENEVSAMQASPTDSLLALERKMQQIFRIGASRQQLLFVAIDSELYLPVLYRMLCALSGNRPIVLDLAFLERTRSQQDSDVSGGMDVTTFDEKYAEASYTAELLEQDLSRSVLIDAYAADTSDDVGSQFLALNVMREGPALGSRIGPGVVLVAISPSDLHGFPGDLYSWRLSTLVLGDGDPSPRSILVEDIPAPWNR